MQNMGPLASNSRRSMIPEKSTAPPFALRGLSREDVDNGDNRILGNRPLSYQPVRQESNENSTQKGVHKKPFPVSYL